MARFGRSFPIKPLIFEPILSAGTLFFESPTGTLTTAGTVARLTSSTKAGTLTTAGALVRQSNLIFEGTLSTAGSLIRETVLPN